jgi:hypothetical protein
VKPSEKLRAFLDANSGERGGPFSPSALGRKLVGTGFYTDSTLIQRWKHGRGFDGPGDRANRINLARVLEKPDDFFEDGPDGIWASAATPSAAPSASETTAPVLSYLVTPRGMSTPPDVAVKLLMADFGVLDPADPDDIHTVRKRLEKNSGVDVQGRMWRILVQDYLDSDLGKTTQPEVAEKMLSADTHDVAPLLKESRRALHELRLRRERAMAPDESPPASPKGKGKKR